MSSADLIAAGRALRDVLTALGEDHLEIHRGAERWTFQRGVGLTIAVPGIEPIEIAEVVFGDRWEAVDAA